MSAAAWYIISYDISDPRRLQKVQRFLRACGYPLQKSVFAWHGDHRQLQQLQHQLKKLIQPSVDDLRGYPVLSGHQLLWWGSLPLPVGVIDESAPKIDLQGG